MKKEIHHATVYYKWRTIRMSKGIEVKSKKWNEAKHETCVDVEIKITKVVSHRYLCMSHDVY